MQDNLVWTSTLDSWCEVTVTCSDDYHGELTISEGNQVLHRESVGLSYGAIFGPDVCASAYHITLIVKDSSGHAQWPGNPSLPHDPRTKCLELDHWARYRSCGWQISPTTLNQL